MMHPCVRILVAAATAGLMAGGIFAEMALAGETTLPALHDVTGVAAGDVLNIRQAPGAASAIIGALPPDAKGIEVVAIQDGWGQINTGEGAGFVTMTYLAPAPGPGWHQLASPFTCFGTEPFWNMSLNPQAMQAAFASPEANDTMAVQQLWPGLGADSGADSGAVSPVAMELDKAILVMSSARCSDGMSDRAFGISASLFLRTPRQAALHGCCSIAP